MQIVVLVQVTLFFQGDNGRSLSRSNFCKEMCHFHFPHCPLITTLHYEVLWGGFRLILLGHSRCVVVIFEYHNYTSHLVVRNEWPNKINLNIQYFKLIFNYVEIYILYKYYLILDAENREDLKDVESCAMVCCAIFWLAVWFCSIFLYFSTFIYIFCFYRTAAGLKYWH